MGARNVGEKARSRASSNSSVNAGFCLDRKKSFVLSCPIGQQGLTVRFVCSYTKTSQKLVRSSCLSRSYSRFYPLTAPGPPTMVISRIMGTLGIREIMLGGEGAL